VESISDKVNDLLINGDLLRFLKKLKINAKRNILTRYKEKFHEFYNIHPSDLGVSPYHSFDKNLKLKLQEILKKNVNLDPTDNINNSTKKFDMPFSKSLIYLSEINRSETIMQKVDVLCNLRNFILDEIDEFWKHFPFQQKKMFVDADNLLSIFIYLIIKSQLSDMIVDIEIIDDFTNKSLKLSRKGYLFSLVQSSLEYLLNTLTSSHIEQNKKEYNNIIEKEYSAAINNPMSIFDASKMKK